MNDASIQDRDEQDTNCRAKHCPFATCKATTANDDGGDHLQLESVRYHRITGSAQIDELHRTRQPSGEPSKDVHPQLHTRNIDSAEPGRWLARAHRVNVSSQHTVA